jgi:hypothetical protein
MKGRANRKSIPQNTPKKYQFGRSVSVTPLLKIKEGLQKVSYPDFLDSPLI